MKEPAGHAAKGLKAHTRTLRCLRFRKRNKNLEVQKEGSMFQLIKNKRGFTLLELLVTIAIIAIIAVLLAPVAKRVIKIGKEGKARAYQEGRYYQPQRNAAQETQEGTAAKGYTLVIKKTGEHDKTTENVKRVTIEGSTITLELE